MLSLECAWLFPNHIHDRAENLNGFGVKWKMACTVHTV
jgi:hypothetical protein